MSNMRVAVAIPFNEMEVKIIDAALGKVLASMDLDTLDSDVKDAFVRISDKLAHAQEGFAEAQAMMDRGPTDGCDCEVCTAMRLAQQAPGSIFGKGPSPAEEPKPKRRRTKKKAESKSSVAIRPAMVWPGPGGGGNN